MDLTMQPRQLYLDTLNRFPTLSACFGGYVSWLCDHCDDELVEYDLIHFLSISDLSRLSMLEEQLNHSKHILGIQIAEFCRLFGFNDDLLASDPEKVHDI